MCIGMLTLVPYIHTNLVRKGEQDNRAVGSETVTIHEVGWLRGFDKNGDTFLS